MPNIVGWWVAGKFNPGDKEVGVRILLKPVRKIEIVNTSKMGKTRRILNELF